MRDLLSLPGLTPSQAHLLLTLRALAVEDSGALWVPRSDVRRAVKLHPAQCRRNLAELERRSLVSRSARLVAASFAPGVEVGSRIHATPVASMRPQSHPCAGSRIHATPVAETRPQSHPCAGRDADAPDVRAAAAGDRAASNRLARRYWAQAERLAERLGAPDVVSDALLRAIASYDGTRGAAFGTHLTWCIRSEARDWHRRDARGLGLAHGGLVDLDQLEAGEVEPAEQVHAARELERAAAAGGDVALDMLAGHSAEETAERLGLSVHAVRRRRTKVRAMLG